MSEEKRRVYCAGPLFTDKEREEMAEIAAALEGQGFATFLPHRDGLEFSPLVPVLVGRGIDPDRAAVLWNQAIFALDAWQVRVGCDALVVNLNGRVPDEGAVAEASMAWCAGKVVVGYKADVRSLVFGHDNAMVSGLFDFAPAGSPQAVAARIRERLDAETVTERESAAPVDRYLDLGGRIADAQASDDPMERIADAVMEFAER